MSQCQQEHNGASFLETMLECDQTEGLGDSFSTLGIHSIFSEDDCSSIVGQKKVTKSIKNRGRGSALTSAKKMEDIAEERKGVSSTDPEDVAMNLRTLLGKGSISKSLLDSGLPRKDLLIDDHKALAQGNRWLESGSKSVSARNFGYEAGAQDMVFQRQMTNACSDIVSQALELTAPLSRAFASMGMAASCRDVLRARDDLDEPPRAPTRERWASRAGMTQSCRHLGVRVHEDRGIATDSAPIFPGGATTKARNTRLKRASSTEKQSKSPETRNTVLSVGKSLSTGYLVPFPAQIAVRPKTVRHLNSREDSSMSGEVLPLSPLVRSKKPSTRDLNAAAPSLNGRRFISYSRALSCKNLKDEAPAVPICTTSATTHRRVNTSDAGLVSKRSLSGFIEKTNRDHKTADVVDSRRALMAKSKSVRHVSCGRKSMISFGKSLSARNLTEADADSLPALSPMTIGTKSPAILRSLLALSNLPFKMEADLVSIPSLSTMSMSMRAATKSPAPLRTKLSSAIALPKASDDESLPSLSPMTPVVVKPAWSPSTAVVPEVSLPPSAVENNAVKGTIQAHTLVDVVVAEEPDEQVSNCFEFGIHPVFSTEEIRREIGSLHMSYLFLEPIPDLSLEPIPEVINKGRPTGRLSSTRASQSCRRLSSTKKESSQKGLKSSSEHGKSRKSPRRGTKQEGSRHDASKLGSSRNLNRSTQERPSPVQEKSTRSLRKFAKKQPSSRKLKTSISADSKDLKRTSSRSSIKKEKSSRTLSFSSSLQRRRSRSEGESQTKSPNCVSSCSTLEKTAGSSPRLSHQRVVRTSIKRDGSSRSISKRSSIQRALNSSSGSIKRDGSNRSSLSKRSSLQRALKPSSKADEMLTKEAERSKMRHAMNTSFRKRCTSFQSSSGPAADGSRTPEIVW